MCSGARRLQRMAFQKIRQQLRVGGSPLPLWGQFDTSHCWLGSHPGGSGEGGILRLKEVLEIEWKNGCHHRLPGNIVHGGPL